MFRRLPMDRKREMIMKHKTVDVVVVGSIGLDDIQTPAESRKSLLGGSVSYACAASAFFAKTGMVGVVGTDFPPDYEALYRDFHIDLDGLQKCKGRTFHWSGVYEADMINRRTLLTELNVFEHFRPDLPEAYREAPFLLLANIAPDLQLHVLRQVTKPRFILADTMDLWINTARRSLMNVIEQVDMVTLNDSEARLLTGIYNLKLAARKILGWGPRYVVIKKGEHGALLVSKKGMFIVPAYPVDSVQDPTGAGDTFAGSFIGQLATGGVVNEVAVRRALLYGSVVASFGVEAFSLTALAGLTRARIRSRLGELQRMIRVA